MEDPKFISRDASSTPGDHDSLERLTSGSTKSSSTPSRSSTSITGDEATGDTSSPDLERILSKLTIHDEYKEHMFRSLATVFRSVQQERLVDLSDVGANSVWACLQRADTASQRGIRDVEALRKIRTVLDEMLWNDSRLLVAAAKTLADGSRDATWRQPFGEAGILDFFLALLATENVPEDLLIQVLRLIGNTCGDNDDNRQRVLIHNHLQFIIRLLGNSRLAPLVISVIYNICSEYDPAQTLAKADGLIPSLVRVLQIESLDSAPFLSHFCRLLDLFSENLDVAEESPDETVEVFLEAASTPDIDIDDCVSLVDAAVAHLKLESFQRHMVVDGLVDVPLKLLFHSYTPQQAPADAPASASGVASPRLRDAEEEEQVSTMRRSIIQALSDISALPEYSQRYAAMDSTHTDVLRRWLAAPHAQIQLCACIMLGNLARSDETCQALVSRFQIHKDLINILKANADTQVLFSTLGFLRNLGLPAENKRILGEADVIATASRFLTTDVLPHLAHTAVGLVRQVINGALPNLWKLLASLSSDEESPAHSKTYLSLMLLLFDKSDDATIKVEVARTVAAILRCINSTGQQDQGSVEMLLDRLFSWHHDIAKPLAMVVSQTRWPIIRSEGWFAMALMARTAGGTAAIDSVLQEVEVFGVLEATIRGEVDVAAGRQNPNLPSSEEEGASPSSDDADPQLREEAAMKRRDRENALVLVNEMLKNRGNEMSDIRRGVLEDLLHGRGSSTPSPPSRAP